MGLYSKKEDDEEPVSNDPFLLLGYGVNAYFDIMFEIMKMMLMISVVCLPLLYVYSSN